MGFTSSTLYPSVLVHRRSPHRMAQRLLGLLALAVSGSRCHSRTVPKLRVGCQTVSVFLEVSLRFCLYMDRLAAGAGEFGQSLLIGDMRIWARPASHDHHLECVSRVRGALVGDDLGLLSIARAALRWARPRGASRQPLIT